MCIGMFTCEGMHMCVYVYRHVHVCTGALCVCVYRYVCVCMGAHVCVYVYKYVHILTRTHVCVYVIGMFMGARVCICA